MSTPRELIERAGIEVKDRGTSVGREHFNIHCPYCLRTKFHLGIHETEGWFRCWACGEKGQWRKLAMKLRELYSGVDWFSFSTGSRRTMWLDDEAPRLPPNLVELTRPFDTFDHQKAPRCDLEAWEYWVVERDLEPELLASVVPYIGVGELRGYLVFEERGDIIARSMRPRLHPRWWKSPNPKIATWGTRYVKHEQPSWVGICEGVFDALALPLGYGVAILGSVASDAWVDEILDTLPPTVEDILLCLDPGVAKKTHDEITLTLRDFGFRIHRFNWMDPRFDDYLDDDEFDLDLLRSEVGREQLFEICQEFVGILESDTNPLL